MVPDSKAARTKIARDRKASGNSASAKNKAVAANKAVAVNRAAAISKADDKPGLVGLFRRRGATPAVLLNRLPIAFSFKSCYNRQVHSTRLCFYEIEH